MTRWITVEQFAADPSLERGYYLIDGEVRPDMGTPHFLHEKVKALVMRFLTEHLLTHKDALVYGDSAFESNP